MKNGFSTSVIILIFLMGCNSRKNNGIFVDILPIYECDQPKLKQIYFESGCNGDKCGYSHTLMLNDYNDSCFNDYDFVQIADKYLDSVQQRLPVRMIRFVKPFDFQPASDSEDIEPLNNNFIVAMYFTDETMHQKVPEISHISIWTDGNEKQLEYLHVSNRTQRMNYYKSKK